MKWCKSIDWCSGSQPGWHVTLGWYGSNFSGNKSIVFFICILLLFWYQGDVVLIHRLLH